MTEAAEYQPISSYGVIGNLRSVALVGLNGSIDWCCFPHLDRPSVFGALLDRHRGGCFRIAPVTPWQSRQRYWPETNVLETTFQTDGGILEVTDWMPLSGNIDGCGKSKTQPAIYRRLQCKGGPVDVQLRWAPRFDYARSKTTIQRCPGGFIAHGRDGERLGLAESFPAAVIVDDGFGPCILARFRLEPAAPLMLATRWGSDDANFDLGAIAESLDITADVWRSWVRKENAQRIRQWAAVDADMMIRSELALRLLIHGETGGVVGAATTSLPEDVGGVRNWDYRFVWIRDASQLIEAFMSLGHRAEVLDFMQFAERSSEHRKGNGDSIQIMYGIHGQRDCPEAELHHLEGYRKSRPVRTGNAGFRQSQHDVFGELLDGAYELVRLGEKIGPEMAGFLRNAADQACTQWREPDHGIWEMPLPREHYVYTKMMTWVALDRAVLLAKRQQLHGNVECWKRERDAVHADILQHGYSAEAGAFVLKYGARDLDAANLMMPIKELLPPEDPRIQGTIDRTIERLSHNDLVYRYRTDDGLAGEEGAFALMSFWLADALAFSGRLEEAHQYLDAVLGKANHLGLFSEQIDPRSGDLLGNFPQVLTHTGLLDTALHLAYFEQSEKLIMPPIGTLEHRREAGRR